SVRCASCFSSWKDGPIDSGIEFPAIPGEPLPGLPGALAGFAGLLAMRRRPDAPHDSGGAILEITRCGQDRHPDRTVRTGARAYREGAGDALYPRGGSSAGGCVKLYKLWQFRM